LAHYSVRNRLVRIQQRFMLGKFRSGFDFRIAGAHQGEKPGTQPIGDHNGYLISSSGWLGHRVNEDIRFLSLDAA
jgi:hypothetical protein